MQKVQAEKFPAAVDAHAIKTAAAVSQTVAILLHFGVILLVNELHCCWYCCSEAH